jgi:Domain of unknown function (DUF3859)
MKIKSVQLIDFGICEMLEADRELSEGSLSGYFLRSDGIIFKERTDIIPAEKNLEFGISYFVEGFDNQDTEDWAWFTCKLIHPKMTNPQTSESTQETTDFKSGYLNTRRFDSFLFEFDWEMVKGKWIFQVLEGRRLLLEKQFLIT